MPECDEDDQVRGGEVDFSASRRDKSDLTSTKNAVDIAFKEGSVTQENLTQELLKTSPIPPEVPHAKGRLFICSIAMSICLIGAALPTTPENIRPALLSIASVVTTALVKPFEKN